MKSIRSLVMSALSEFEEKKERAVEEERRLEGTRSMECIFLACEAARNKIECFI